MQWLTISAVDALLKIGFVPDDTDNDLPMDACISCFPALPHSVQGTRFSLQVRLSMTQSQTAWDCFLSDHKRQIALDTSC